MMDFIFAQRTIPEKALDGQNIDYSWGKRAIVILSFKQIYCPPVHHRLFLRLKISNQQDRPISQKKIDIYLKSRSKK